MKTGFTKVQVKCIEKSMEHLAIVFTKGGYAYACNELDHVSPNTRRERHVTSKLFEEFYEHGGPDNSWGTTWASKEYRNDTQEDLNMHMGFKILLLALFLEVGPNGIK